jgi:hypothetical protein
MGKLRQLFSTLLTIGILTTCALAQTNLTQIRDTINNPDGTPFNGTLVITWVGLSSPTSGSVSPLSTSAHIYNGALSVLLVPTTTAAAGSYYQVVYNSGNGIVTWTETWSVPPSTTALTVSSVRTSSTSGSGTSTGTGGGGTTTTQYATLPIAISQVTGLSADLNTLNNSLTTLQTTVSGLDLSGLSSLTNTVNGLSTSVSANTTNITALTTSVNSLTTSSASNSSNLAALSTTVGNLSTSVASLNTAVTALQASGVVKTLNMTFIDGEVPGGVTNGSNVAFTLSQGPTPAGSLELYRNGLVQTSAVDYTISGTAITFLSGNIPAAGDVLQAYYRAAGSSPLPTFVDDEVPGGLVNGSNLTFTLAAAPTPQIGLKLYKNGMLMQQHSDYTLSGSNIAFVSASMPQPGDAIVAYYRY